MVEIDRYLGDVAPMMGAVNTSGTPARLHGVVPQKTAILYIFLCLFSSLFVYFSFFSVPSAFVSFLYRRIICVK
jgi:hypothetical protein